MADNISRLELFAARMVFIGDFMALISSFLEREADKVKSEKYGIELQKLADDLEISGEVLILITDAIALLILAMPTVEEDD